VTTQEERLNAGRAVVAKVLAEEVAGIVKDVRQVVEPSLAPEEKVSATLPDGTKVGTVGRSKVIQVAAVTDMKAFTEWVKANRPDEIIQPEPFVRASYLEHVKETAKRHGAPVDEATGEIIPGIELRDGTAMYRVTATDEGREIILSRIKQLMSAELLALPATTEKTQQWP
jgi:hypothetical protein